MSAFRTLNRHWSCRIAGARLLIQFWETIKPQKVHMVLIYVYVLLFSFLAFAPAAAAAGTTLGTPENQQQPQPLRHGTLLLSSVTLLDRQPPSHVPQRLLQNQTGSTDAQQHHSCCLTVKAYTTAALPGSTTAQHAAQTPHSTVASAVFSTCSNSTKGSCSAALLQAAHGSHSGPYKVALLLSAPADHNSATAHEALSGHVQKDDTSTSDTTPADDVSSSSSMPSAAEDLVAAGLEQESSTVAAAGGASKASILHDMLITIHAEQEMSGQVYLAFATQLVRAGTGVVRADVNMSHYTHTWTSARLLHTSKQDREPSTTATASDNVTASPADSEAAAAQAAGPGVASCGPAQEHVSAPTVDDQLAPSSFQAAEGPAVQAPAPQTASSPTGLLDLLPPHLTAEPSAVAAFLQAALGHDPAGQQQAAAACQRTSCTGSSSSSRRQSSSCFCPALSGDPTAIQDCATDAQAALSSCRHEASLQEQLQAAAASHNAAVSLAQPTMPQARQHSLVQAWISRAKVTGGPAGSAACLLDKALAAAASELPFISSATPDQLLLGLAAATAFLVLLMVKGCSSNRGKPRSSRRAAVPQPPQQQAVTVSAAEQQQKATAVHTAQDAWPLQEQDQGDSLDDVLQGIDADPFGYGAAPTTATTAPAAPAAAAPASGSLLAAAKAVKRASAMAAGEAAGALKDAFMRRNTSRSGAAAAAGLGSGSAAGGTAAGAGAGLTADWLNEEDEDKVNQLPDSAQRQLQAGGRWARDAEGRLVRSSWKAVRNSLAAAAQTVLAAVGVGSGDATAAGPAATETAAAGGTAAGAALTGTAAAAVGDVGEWRDSQDAAALQQLLSAAPGSVVTFAAS